ncbi:hypothetical protein Adt_02851 [Abeliophyllum distichum]|uniref:Uncharacterized protein n=1 Tax=Abeliophyllum distichum TaxID=126358 RepID=A0ABD1VWW3_9LAMI
MARLTTQATIALAVESEEDSLSEESTTLGMEIDELELQQKDTLVHSLHLLRDESTCLPNKLERLPGTMAPKRKDPPTKKGKEKAGSSSGRHRPLETNVDAGGIRRFRGPEEELIYNKWLMPKHIWAERELPALDFEAIPADFDMTQVTQFLYGRADAWPLAGPKFLHNQLTESLRIFHIFVCHNIDPTSHHTDFKESRAQFLYHLASGAQYASGRSPMFSCLISVPCLADGVPLLPHEEAESPEPPITKWTLGNPVARRAADNPAPLPAAETDRLLRQIFTQLSEQGQVLNYIQRDQLAMQRTVDHMRIEIDSLKESNNTLRGGQRTINFTYDNVNHRMLQFAQRLDDIYTVLSQPSAPSAPHHGSAPDDPSDHPGPSSLHLPPRST